MSWICAALSCVLLLDILHLAFTFTVLTAWQLIPRLLLAAAIGIAGTISILTR